MKTMCAAVVLLIPSVVLADELATSICVLTKSDVDALVKKSGSIKKVPTRQLWDKAVYRGYIGDKVGSRVSAEFKHGDRQLRLLATRPKKAKVLYSVRDVSTPGKETLVGAGAIVSGEETKKDTDGESYVVVVRVGNFLLK